MTQSLSGPAHDLTLGFPFSPATHVTERAISNTAYSFAPPTLSEADTRDGLNRYTAVAGRSPALSGLPPLSPICFSLRALPANARLPKR